MKLRQAGLAVVAAEAGDALLEVDLVVLKRDDEPRYACAMKFQLLQKVILERNGFRSAGVTWSTPLHVGTFGSERFPEGLRQRMRDYVDQFLNAYLAVNPKRSRDRRSHQLPWGDRWLLRFPLTPNERATLGTRRDALSRLGVHAQVTRLIQSVLLAGDIAVPSHRKSPQPGPPEPS